MKTAGFFKRILALVYDSLLIGAIVLVLSLLLVFVNGGYPESGSLVSFVQFLIILFTGPIFYSYFWILNDGQTTGMQAWKIKLICINNNKISLNTAFTRCLASTLSFLFLGLGYLWIFFDKDNHSWSDKLTNTEIINID